MPEEVDVEVPDERGQAGPFHFGTALVDQLVVKTATGFVAGVEGLHFDDAVRPDRVTMAWIGRGVRCAPAALIVALLVLSGCKREMPVGSADDRSTEPFHEGAREGCDLKPDVDCPAQDLPRVTENEWTAGELTQMLRQSTLGTVALDRSGGTTRLVPDCRLDGTYTEVRGEPGSGRFWATDRLVFLPGELGSACRAATHAVAVFATAGLPAAAGAGATVPDGGRVRFSAILVPLPCPPATDPAPAKGCIGKGATGPERKARALDLWAKGGAQFGAASLSRRFEVYALMPDDHRGIDYLQYPHADCFLEQQIREARFGTPAARWPRFSTEDTMGCANVPPFLTCFPGLFDPAPGGRSCWRPAGF